MSTPTVSPTIVRKLQLDCPSRVAHALMLLLAEASRQGGLDPAATVGCNAARVVIVRAGRVLGAARPE